LCFYIPRVVVTKFRLGGSAIKRFFNRPVSQVKALGAGLAGGVAGGVKAIRKQDS
jgi:hypothetical protein